MNKSTLAIAIAALLVGGVAVAAYQKFHQPDASAVVAAAPAAVAASAREARPGKATAIPICSPAAPAMPIANNSVVPWIESHAVSWRPSPLGT